MAHPVELLEADVSHLAAIDRPSCSEGERESAEWIAERLRESGCEVAIEEERAHGTYWWPLGLGTGLGLVSGLAALRGRRLLGLAGAAAAGTLIADTADGGPLRLRERFLANRTCWNVVAQTGDLDAERTLVIHAHHDAAHSGLIFHPAPQKLLWEKTSFVDNTDTSIPMHLPVVGGPALVALGALTGVRALMRAGVGLSAIVTAALTDIGMRAVVPGANDNLSGVAILLSLARELAQRPIEGLRVILLSAGSEESFQEGIRAFGRRHFDSLPRDRTWFLNLDSVGSPKLALLEGEGPLYMRDYPEEFKTLVQDTADDAGIALWRGLRGSVSTDGETPMRAGYPTATLVSVTDWKAIANYHWPTDTAENVDYGTVAQAARLSEAVARRLAAGG
jgi:hypothetical protein